MKDYKKVSLIIIFVLLSIVSIFSSIQTGNQIGGGAALVAMLQGMIGIIFLGCSIYTAAGFIVQNRIKPESQSAVKFLLTLFSIGLLLIVFLNML